MNSSNSVLKISFSILAVCAVAVLVIFALKDKIEKEAEGIYEKRSMLAVLEKRNENFLLLKADSQTLEEDLPLLKKALLDEDSIDDAVNALENLANRTNNTQSLNFEPLSHSQFSGGSKALGFSATLIGNMGSLAKYLKGIKELPYPIEISAVSLTNDLGIANNGSRLVLSAKIYIKK